MKIAFISPEVYPFAKTGGLADVSYSLPDALVRRGHDLAVIMPAYRQIDKTKSRLRLLIPDLSVSYCNEEKSAAAYISNEITYFTAYFIEYNPYFGRDGFYNDIYGDFTDNSSRFAFFCISVLELLKKIDFKPDIIHCNEWQTGPLPLFLKNLYSRDKHFNNTSTVITVHNAGYQGIFDNCDFLSMIKEDNINDITTGGKVNFLKTGIMFSDIITTVSAGYASEIQTEEFGYGLAGIFRKRNDRLYGILNGIDGGQWNPAEDTFIPERYSITDLKGRSACKRDLQSRMGLPVDKNIPLLGLISRLTYQKGLDVLSETLEYLLQDEPFQFIVTGSGDERIYQKFERLRGMFPEKIGLFYGYNEQLSHIIHAGLDIFVMPSRYEPCGLSVMYSLKYGAVPVARATGGLDEIILDRDINNRNVNGFKFNNLTIDELYNAIRRAIKLYKDRKEWSIIQKNAMRFSRTWDDAVLEYETIYKKALNYQKY
jgi:starch synthase